METITLDSLHLDISLMKVDVEGEELRVLEGGRETLKGVRHLFVEIWPEANTVKKGMKPAFDKMVGFLAPLGFRLSTWLMEDLCYFRK